MRDETKGDLKGKTKNLPQYCGRFFVYYHLRPEVLRGTEVDLFFFSKKFFFLISVVKFVIDTPILTRLHKQILFFSSKKLVKQIFKMPYSYTSFLALAGKGNFTPPCPIL